MGVVDAVWQRSLDREVAIKRLVAKPNRTHVEALLAEAGMMGRLEHPNIVPVHALGACPNRGPLLVMKRVRGIAWSELLKDPEHPAWGAHVEDRLDRNLEILVAICNACHFAHSRGIIHRDIKPQNVMVGDYGEVYLMDWGIATTAESPPSSEVLGSPAYMAPELALGVPAGCDSPPDPDRAGSKRRHLTAQHPDRCGNGGTGGLRRERSARTGRHLQ
jgi:serine/threonine-protein kinase